MNQESFAAFLDVMGQAVLIAENGRVVAINREACEVFQLQQQSAIGRNVIEVIRHHRLEQLLRDTGEQELEFAGRTLHAKSFDIGNSKVLLLTDITAPRKRETELREVMAVLSHEFRTPVAAIKAVLEVLEYNPPEEQRKTFIHQAQQETMRLVRLVEDLTVGFKPQSQRRFFIGEAFARVLRLAQAELTRRDVRVRAEGEELLVYCDADKLVQVILNLVENAARHGPNPGVVRIVAAQQANNVHVSVHDQGQTLNNYDQLFAAHMRGQNSTGSGMGLYIVQTVVQTWGGTVWAKRDNNLNGNIFGFSLPVPTEIIQHQTK